MCNKGFIYYQNKAKQNKTKKSEVIPKRIVGSLTYGQIVNWTIKKDAEKSTALLFLKQFNLNFYFTYPPLP